MKSISGHGGSPPFKRGDRIRVLIAERNCMAGQLLAESLERDSRFQVMTKSAPTEILEMVTKHEVDVAVISADFDFGTRKGFQLARTLNASGFGGSIVILLDVPERESVIAAFHSGARAVFCRTEPLSGFRTCVERISHGEMWAGSVEAEYLLDVVRSSLSFDVAACDALRPLSKREIEVAELAIQGLTNKEIANQLHLSQHTIKNYLFRIFEKLGVSNRIELLFRLSYNGKGATYQASALSTAVPENHETHLKAAEDGSVTAQFALGMAYLDGLGVEQNEASAYYWLRRAEKNATEIAEHSAFLIEGLRAEIESGDIDALEQRIATQKDMTAVNQRDSGPAMKYIKPLKLAG
jgi:two-component system nitrate/nitrite response regulator NarL